MSFLHSWLWKQNGGPRAVNELGGPVIPGKSTYHLLRMNGAANSPRKGLSPRY